MNTTSGLLEALSALHDATATDPVLHRLAHDALLQVTGEHDAPAQHRTAKRWRSGWGGRSEAAVIGLPDHPPVEAADGTTLHRLSASDVDFLTLSLNDSITTLEREIAESISVETGRIRARLIGLRDRLRGLPAHEDETDCPNPAACRAHRGVLA